jgi:hypothetical protein
MPRFHIEERTAWLSISAWKAGYVVLSTHSCFMPPLLTLKASTPAKHIAKQLQLETGS